MHNMFSKKSTRGFTLIELLVVIAIIGILASIVLVSLNGARAKGRDAKRVADLQQFARAAALSTNADTSTAFAGCDAGGDLASTCTDPAFGGGADPLGGTACAAAYTAPVSGSCNYAVSAASAYATAPTFSNWQVKAYLESGAGSLSSGYVFISNATSSITACTLAAGCK